MAMDIEHVLSLGDLIHVQIGNDETLLLLSQIRRDGAAIRGNDAGTPTTGDMIQLAIAELLLLNALLAVDSRGDNDEAAPLDGMRRREVTGALRRVLATHFFLGEG